MLLVCVVDEYAAHAQLFVDSMKHASVFSYNNYISVLNDGPTAFRERVFLRYMFIKQPHKNTAGKNVIVSQILN